MKDDVASLRCERYWDSNESVGKLDRVFFACTKLRAKDTEITQGGRGVKCGESRGSGREVRSYG